jgi:hypothetical protein
MPTMPTFKLLEKRPNDHGPRGSSSTSFFFGGILFGFFARGFVRRLIRFFNPIEKNRREQTEGNRKEGFSNNDARLEDARKNDMN